MNDAEQYLSTQLPIGGVSAYSIQVRNGVLETQCLSKSLYPACAEQMLNRVVQSGRALLPCGESAAQYCWTFEGHLVFVALRPDGVCLALLVENNPSSQLNRVRETLKGFLELQEA
jgi:hypothetical protein